MTKAQLIAKNGVHQLIPITLEQGQPPPKFQHQGRVYTLAKRIVSTGKSEICAVYSEA